MVLELPLLVLGPWMIDCLFCEMALSRVCMYVYKDGFLLSLWVWHVGD